MTLWRIQTIQKKCALPLTSGNLWFTSAVASGYVFYGIITFPVATPVPPLSAPFSAKNRQWWHRQQKRRCCTSASSSLRLHSPGRLGVVAKTPLRETRRGWGQPGIYKEELQTYHTATAVGGHSQPARGSTDKQIYSKNHRLSMDNSPMDRQWRMPSKSLQIIDSLRFMPSLRQKTGGNMGYFCFLLTPDFGVEEEKLADKILCLFGEK